VRISRELPANSKVVVINFRSDSEELNDYVIDELTGAIIRNRRVILVKLNKGQLQSIRDELGLNTVGEITDESAHSIGRLLGVQYLITGSIERIGSEYKILFTAVDTNAEPRSEYSVILNPQNDAQLALLLGVSPVNTPSSQESARAKKEPITVNPETNARLNTLGVSVGSGVFFDPFVFFTVHGTYAPVRNLFLEIGCNVGFVSVYADDLYIYSTGVEAYYSIYPFAHIGVFLPFSRKGGWYFGAGAGYMIGEYTFAWGKAPVSSFTADFLTGFNFWNFLDVSFTVRTDFNSANYRVSIGYVKRF
jgi:TolB-like protein